MLDLPPEPVRNTPITAEWGRKVVRALRALCPVAGAGMAVDISPNGTTYRLAASPTPKRSSGLELRPWQPKLILEAFSSGSSGGPIYRLAMTVGKIVYQTAEGETTFPEIEHKEADIGTLERSCFQIPNNVLTETTLYLVCDRSGETPRWTFELAAANKPLAESDAAGVLRFRRKAIAEIDLSKNTLTPLIHGSRLEVADPAAKGAEEAPVAWTVRSRLEMPPEGVGDPERVWEVYHPVWICGRSTYLPEGEGMTQGAWNLLDKTLESGTLYAVLQEKASALASDDDEPAWTFEKVYLTNKTADIPDEAQPDRYYDGHRCTVVAIGCFSGSGESLKWSQWHVGAIVERTPGTGGKDGKDGKDGVDGEDGKDGTNGKDGAVWVPVEIFKGTGGSSGFEADVYYYKLQNTETNEQVTLKIGALDGADGADGANGADGKDGKDGVSVSSVTTQAVAATSGTPAGTKVTITLSNGTTKTFTIYNGKDGADGADGEDGKDATLPTAQSLTVVTAVSYSSTTHKLTYKKRTVTGYFTSLGTESTTTVFTATPHSEEHS